VRLVAANGTLYDLDLGALDILHALASVDRSLNCRYVRDRDALEVLLAQGLIVNVPPYSYTVTARGRTVHEAWMAQR
jgi:hypothetical protein